MNLKNLFSILALTFVQMGNIHANQVEQLVEPLQTYSSIPQDIKEQEVFYLINQNRVANFLKPLTWSAAAATQARNHSLNMADKIVPFGHQGADLRFSTLRSLIPFMTRFGENVAYNRGYPNPVEIAVSGWLRSPGHYANIMGDFNLTGTGVAKNILGEYYFTQIFVKASVFNQILESDEDAVQELELNACEGICEKALLVEFSN